MEWPEDLKFSLKKGSAKKGRRAAAAAPTPTSPLDSLSSKPTSPTGTELSQSSMNSFEIDEITKTQPPKRISGGWAENTTKSGKLRSKNFVEDERFKKSIEVTYPEEDIPIIPDIDDIQDEIILNNIVEPPSVSVNRVVTLKELNSDLLTQKAFLEIEDVDLSILTKFLYLEKDLEELDELWQWEQVFTETTAEMTIGNTSPTATLDNNDRNNAETGYMS